MESNKQPPAPANYYNPQEPRRGDLEVVTISSHNTIQDVEQGQGSPKYDDNESQEWVFSDKSIRRGFIRKVYSILMVQLLITFGFVILFAYNNDIRLWTQANPGVLLGAIIITIVLVIAMSCCESVRRRSPTNLICLGLFTVAEGFLLGAVSSKYDEKSVLLALGLTTVIVLSLTIFSFQTKYDMTGMGGCLFILLIVLIVFGVLASLLSSVIPVMKSLYGCGGALLFSAYLVYDTQMMMGGDHKYSLSPEEYVFAALSIYLDIINIFIFLLRIFGSGRS